MMRVLAVAILTLFIACGSDEDPNRGIEGEPIDRDICKEHSDCLDQPRFHDSRLAECIAWTYEPNRETGMLEDTGNPQWLYCSECKENTDCPDDRFCERFTWCSPR